MRLHRIGVFLPLWLPIAAVGSYPTLFTFASSALKTFSVFVATIGGMVSVTLSRPATASQWKHEILNQKFERNYRALNLFVISIFEFRISNAKHWREAAVSRYHFCAAWLPMPHNGVRTFLTADVLNIRGLITQCIKEQNHYSENHLSCQLYTKRYPSHLSFPRRRESRLLTRKSLKVLIAFKNCNEESVLLVKTHTVDVQVFSIWVLWIPAFAGMTEPVVGRPLEFTLDPQSS